MAALHCFCSRKIATEMLHFQGFLPLQQPFVATLSDTRQFIYRKHLAKQDMNFQNLLEIYELL